MIGLASSKSLWAIKRDWVNLRVSLRGQNVRMVCARNRSVFV